MKKYKVSIGRSMIIEANSPEEAEEEFNEMVNECICNDVSVIKIKKSTSKERKR